MKIILMKIILILLVFFSCKRNNANFGDIDNDWKIDSIGCSGLRKPDLAKKLIEINKLEQKNVSDFEIVFGNPNEIRGDFLEKTYVYYFSSVCKDDKLVKDGDKCYAEFYFINSNFKSVSFICE